MKKKDVRIKIENCQHLNQREIKLIEEHKINGLLLFDVKQHRNKIELLYNVEGFVSFFEFLQLNNMSKRLFVVLLRNVVLTLRHIEENCFSKDLLMWSLQSSYVDPASWHVYMMYVPLQPYETIGNLKTFLLEIISACNFCSQEDTEYVKTLVQELNGVTSYTVGMLERFCDKVSEELIRSKNTEDSPRLCPYCGSKLVAEEENCPFCGKRIVARKLIYQKDDIFTAGDDFLSLESHLHTEQKGLVETTSRNSTISVNEDENGVVTVFGSSRNREQNVWLEDREHVGKIPVTKFPFRIGKMEGVTDYRILNNTVSRKHADILKEQGKYYIVDLGSTNGTYLNSKKIQPGVKEELSDGILLTFADAEFKFHID